MGKDPPVGQGLVGSMSQGGRLDGVVGSLKTPRGRPEPSGAVRKPGLDLNPESCHARGEGRAGPQVAVKPGGERDRVPSGKWGPWRTTRIHPGTEDKDGVERNGRRGA